jgi:hypothetical protein
VNNLQPFRMFAWLAAGLLLYCAAYLVSSQYPAAQVVFYKLGHVTTLAWFGYWISRQALGRVKPGCDASDKLSRAVLIAGVLIAGSLGL